MTSVLDEVIDDRITRYHVERRVDDWVRRLGNLYERLESWLPSGWSAERGNFISLDEEMMRRTGVPPRQIPTLELAYRGRRVARLEPRALWIVGANGRVDLHTQGDHFLLIDEAESFAEPRWTISPLRDRGDRKPLPSARFASALGE